MAKQHSNAPRHRGTRTEQRDRVIAEAVELNAGPLDIDRSSYVGDADRRELTAALDVITGHGFADERTGDVDWHGHFARVDRFILHTVSNGNATALTFPDPDAAEREMSQIEQAYGEWMEGQS